MQKFVKKLRLSRSLITRLFPEVTNDVLILLICFSRAKRRVVNKSTRR